MLTGSNVRFSNFGLNVEPSTEEEEQGYVCIANISPLERRKRLNFSIIQFVVSLPVLAALLITGADKSWRLPLFLLFAAGASSYFQWRDKT